MNTRMKRALTGAAAALLLGGAALAAPAEKLPPCVPDKPVPAGGCMAPKDPVTPLDTLKPAPPLAVPPSGDLRGELRPAPPLTVPPGIAPPTSPSGAPGTDSPAVVKPPPTGDGEIVKPAPRTDPKMPVIKPKPGIEPRT